MWRSLNHEYGQKPLRRKISCTIWEQSASSHPIPKLWAALERSPPLSTRHGFRAITVLDVLCLSIYSDTGDDEIYFVDAVEAVSQVITRTWQTAHKMKLQRGRSVEPPSSGNDNFRIKRYVAKYTINPAIANGFSELVGSVEVRKSPSLLSLPRVQIAPLPPHSIRRTPAPGRKTRGPRHVEAFFLRCQAGDGDQGRRRCVGKHGGPQRQHPHPRAGAPIVNSPPSSLPLSPAIIPQSLILPRTRR